MAIKTFTDAVALPASDINTYLANSGWVYVNSGTFATSGFVQVNNVFTSTYTNYKIVFHNLLLTAGTNSAILQLSASGTPAGTNGYYSGSQFWTFAVTPATAPFGDSNSGSWGGLYLDSTVRSSAEWTFYNPAVAVPTQQTYNTIAWTNSVRVGGGVHNVATAYDGFRLTPTTSTISGTWSVYGQRNA
jgi:hypothetical protein